MFKYIKYLFFIVCSGCSRKFSFKREPTLDSYTNINDKVEFTKRTISGNNNIDYTEPFFIFLLISLIVFTISFLPFILAIYRLTVKKILTFFKNK